MLLQMYHQLAGHLRRIGLGPENSHWIFKQTDILDPGPHRNRPMLMSRQQRLLARQMRDALRGGPRLIGVRQAHRNLLQRGTGGIDVLHLEMPVGQRVEGVRNLRRGMAGLRAQPVNGQLRR